MFEVHPVETKLEQEALCARCGVIYKEEALAYEALRDGEFAGICQFMLTGGIGRIADLAASAERRNAGTDDSDILFLMGRAALNFIDMCGVHTAYFDENSDNFTDSELIKRIGFRKNASGRLEMNLTDFFFEPCKHNQD